MISNSIRCACLCLTAMAAALMSGCSSKPDAGDIDRQMQGVIKGCPTIEVVDVKKVDGAPRDRGQYEVAYSYTVRFKGGKEAALKYFETEMALASASAAFPVVSDAEREMDKAHTALQMNENPETRVRMDRAEEAWKRDREERRRAGERRAAHGCQDSDGRFLLGMLGAALPKPIAAGEAAVSVPLAIPLQATGVMIKAESGWTFVGQGPVKTEGPIFSEPLVFKRPNAQAAATNSTGVRTLVGALKLGATDSCFNVASGSGEKCYGLTANGPQMQAIVAGCGDGAKCEVTGRFDDAKDELVAVGSANAIK